MASLVGAISNLYLTSTSASDLRAIVGDSLYSDVLPPDYNRPFVVIEEAGTTVFGEAKARTNRKKIIEVSIVFAVYGDNRPQVETILDELETVFLESAPQLTVDNRTHMATYFSNRQHNWDGEGWFGTLTLNYQLQKN